MARLNEAPKRPISPDGHRQASTLNLVVQRPASDSPSPVVHEVGAQIGHFERLGHFLEADMLGGSTGLESLGPPISDKNLCS